VFSSPRNGTVWRPGDTETIEWDFFRVPPTIHIELLVAETLQRYGSYLAVSVANNASYTYIIPSEITEAYYVVRLSDVSDVSLFADSPAVLIARAPVLITGEDDEESTTAHLWHVPLIAAGVGMVLAGEAYRRHQKENEGKAKISEVQFALIEVSMIDVSTDFLYVIEVWWHPVFGPTALAFLILSLVANAVLVMMVLQSSLDTGKTKNGSGLYAMIIMLSVTSPDLLALLPWEDGEGGDGDFDANGFPDRVKKLVDMAKMVEDVPQFIIQLVYSTMESDRANVLTWMSLGASTLSLVWRGLVRCLAGGGVVASLGAATAVAGGVTVAARSASAQQAGPQELQMAVVDAKNWGRVSTPY